MSGSSAHDGNDRYKFLPQHSPADLPRPSGHGKKMSSPLRVRVALAWFLCPPVICQSWLHGHSPHVSGLRIDDSWWTWNPLSVMANFIHTGSHSTYRNGPDVRPRGISKGFMGLPWLSDTKVIHARWLMGVICWREREAWIWPCSHCKFPHENWEYAFGTINVSFQTNRKGSSKSWRRSGRICKIMQRHLQQGNPIYDGMHEKQSQQWHVKPEIRQLY